jgi:hypothetical protein
MAMEKQTRPTLEDRVDALEGLFVRLAQSGQLEEVLDRGFDRMTRRMKSVSKTLGVIATQMEPLQRLGPQASKEPQGEDALIVKRLRKALESPDPRQLPPPRIDDNDDFDRDQRRSAP